MHTYTVFFKAHSEGSRFLSSTVIRALNKAVMTYSILGHQIVGRVIGRSKALDPNGRRYYRLVSLRTSLVYEVSGDLLREYVG